MNEENMKRLTDAIMSGAINDIAHALIYFEGDDPSTNLTVASIQAMDRLDLYGKGTVYSDHSGALLVAVDRRLKRLGYPGIYPEKESQ